MRDLVADILHVSPAQVGRMEKINKNLSSEFKGEFQAGNIGITAAYELSGQSQEEQEDSLKRYRKDGVAVIRTKPQKTEQPKPAENQHSVAAESQPANTESRLEIKTRKDAIKALESIANRIERQSAVGRGEMVRTIRAAIEALRR